jgi:hypothetical protein
MLSRFDHVHRKINGRIVKILYDWKLMSTGLAGSPKITWENDIKENIRIMKINNLTKCI